MDFETLMELALSEAEKAFKEGEVPVGAVIELNGRIIGRGHNSKEKDCSATSHAEVKAISEAGKRLGNWRLDGATIAVTVEPCMMCWGAILESRIKRVIIGTQYGPLRQPLPREVLRSHPHGKHLEIIEGVLKERCAALVKEFFARVRETKGRGGRVVEGARLEIE